MENKQEMIFTDGVFIKQPHDKVKDFISASISIQVEVFKKWLDKHVNENGYVNLDLRKSKDGTKQFLSLNTWKPTPKDNPQDSIPF